MPSSRTAGSVYAFADARKVTVWTEVSASKSMSLGKLENLLQQASTLVDTASSKTYVGDSPEAQEVGLSTSLGINVVAFATSLIIYLDFYKEGTDRTPEQQLAMRWHLKNLGFRILARG